MEVKILIVKSSQWNENDNLNGEIVVASDLLLVGAFIVKNCKNLTPKVP